MTHDNIALCIHYTVKALFLALVIVQCSYRKTYNALIMVRPLRPIDMSGVVHTLCREINLPSSVSTPLYKSYLAMYVNIFVQLYTMNDINSNHSSPFAVAIFGVDFAQHQFSLSDLSCLY